MFMYDNAIIVHMNGEIEAKEQPCVRLIRQATKKDNKKKHKIIKLKSNPKYAYTREVYKIKLPD